MKIKYLLSVMAIVAVTKTTYAQYAQDALRFSTSQPGSTSRIKALGNAGTAVGGDLSSIGNNPAGLGFFTHSEFSITPEFNGSKVTTNYFGQGNQATQNQLNLNNASVVFYSKVNNHNADKTKGWLSVNFGVGYNRTNNYYQNSYYAGKNPNTSISNYYAEQANNYGVSDPGSLAGWAYNQNLIDNYQNGTGTIYKSNALPGVDQAKSTFTTGGESEIDLSMGANYSNKLYLGVGIGITDLRYNTSSAFIENGTASVLENGTAVNRGYNSVYSQDQQTRGTGFNARFGLIYKPVEVVRLGVTFTTPTWYNIDDNYNEALATKLSSGSSGASGNNYPFNYNLRTPLKVAGGASVFIGNIGFITGDVEYEDYSSMNLDYDGSQPDNSDIKRLYKSVVNAHVGAEIKADQLYIRGGYGVQGNPLQQYGGNINTISGGLGYRFAAYYVDATYTHVSGNSVQFPYELTTATNYGADVKNVFNNVFLTLGMRF
jgi:hypothetical protein